jgi:PAS domain S-box-containing protein
MDERRRILMLLITMTAVAIGVGGVMLLTLYGASFEQQRERLVETAQSNARLIEAVARFDATHSAQDIPGGPFAATISQIRDAHKRFRGFGKTGEFTLAKREDDQIVFLLSHRHYDLEDPRPVPFSSQLAEPMRRALSGKSGTVIGFDYRGERVLAAYEPVEELNLGIVAKIDLKEIRAPFIRAGLLATGGGFVLIFIGTISILRIGTPMVRHLQESEEKYRMLFENAGDSIFIIDPSNRQFLDFNQNAAQRLGYERVELLQLAINDIDAPTSAKKNDAIMRELKETGSIVFEHTHLTKGGREIPVEISSRVIEYGGRQVFQSIARDMTDRKRAEEALRESEKRYRSLSESLEEAVVQKVEELRRAETLASIGRMVSVVSHEVRNPLQNIQLGLDALSDEVGEDATIQEILEEITYGVEILNGIISNLLEYAKPPNLAYSSHSITGIVKQALNLVEHKLGDIDVHLELPKENKEISVDVIKLTTVLVNLISNAAEAMPGGGNVKVCSQFMEDDEHKMLRLTISDTGSGIKGEHLEQIYEPFFTTKTSGVGLGIPTCRKIIEAHNGSMNIKSSIGEGTVVEIRLPVLEP